MAVISSPGHFSDARKVREVWEQNLDVEFDALCTAVKEAGPGAIVALDTEFPGVARDVQPRSSIKLQYEAVRCSVELLQPIQVGLAVARADGTLAGSWSFNLRFDLEKDLHREKAVAFLRAVGVDFPRHAAEGTDVAKFGQLLAKSNLFGDGPAAPWWVTFSGLPDLCYLLKLFTNGAPLPRNAALFLEALAAACPQRHELRDWLPHGSLDLLALEYEVRRSGASHTAGSDALATLELYLKVVPPACRVTLEAQLRERQAGCSEGIALIHRDLGVTAIVRAPPGLERGAEARTTGPAVASKPFTARKGPAAAGGAAERSHPAEDLASWTPWARLAMQHTHVESVQLPRMMGDAQVCSNGITSLPEEPAFISGVTGQALRPTPSDRNARIAAGRAAMTEPECMRGVTGQTLKPTPSDRNAWIAAGRAAMAEPECMRGLSGRLPKSSPSASEDNAWVAAARRAMAAAL